MTTEGVVEGHNETQTQTTTRRRDSRNRTWRGFLLTSRSVELGRSVDTYLESWKFIVA